MTLTVKDASRAYRQRRADRIQRYEDALLEIAEANYPFAREIARQALALTPHEMEGK